MDAMETSNISQNHLWKSISHNSNWNNNNNNDSNYEDDDDNLVKSR